jgi:hypothetical protein
MVRVTPSLILNLPPLSTSRWTLAGMVVLLVMLTVPAGIIKVVSVEPIVARAAESVLYPGSPKVLYLPRWASTRSRPWSKMLFSVSPLAPREGL